MAATTGVAAEEQGLAAGLVSSAFQLGGAFSLAVVSAVVTAVSGTHPAETERLSAFHAGLWVCAAIAYSGLVISVSPLWRGVRTAVVQSTEECS